MGMWWSSVPALPEDVHIVVVGAGYGGIALGNKLMKHKANFTIINSSDCFHHCAGALRAAVHSDFLNKTLIPLEQTFGHHFKRGNVVDVKTQDKKIVLENGEEIQYDILILATGSKGPFPGKFDMTSDTNDAKKKYLDISQKIKDSERIAVIGGGATGTELCVEIAHKYRQKHVSLIHSKDYLINDQFTDNFQKKLKGILKRYNVNMILGEPVENMSEISNGASGVVKMNSGKEIEADLIFKTIGLPVNTSAYERAFKHVMEPNGQLKVDQLLKVKGYTDIYAIGDCCNSKDIKTAYCAGEHAKHLVQNLLKRFSGQVEQNWKAGSLPGLLVLALGPETGLGQLKNGWVLGEWVSWWVKAHDTMAGNFWKAMKQPLPA